MVAVALGLAASASWGLADFIGGTKSRTLDLLAVLVVSQGVALVLLAVAVAVRAEGLPSGESLLYAAGAGVAGVCGLAALYRGLAVGAMAVVAPIAALGAGIPVTPWDWSFDLDEVSAGRILSGMPEDCVLILHSPPLGHADADSSGRHLGSEAITAAIAEHVPRLAVCGHIHDSWGQRSSLGDCEIVNLGPAGTVLEL